jgi:hypothetical protein
MKHELLRNALVTLASFVVVITVVSAWTGPTVTAPNGNVSTPLTISATSQSKAGGLDVAWLSSVGGIKVGQTSAVCNATIGGTLRYNSSLRCVEFCDETTWKCTNQAATPPPPCSATTVGNCSLPASPSGSSSGSCQSGYSGSCNFSCSNGVWTQNSNTCTLSCGTGYYNNGGTCAVLYSYLPSGTCGGSGECVYCYKNKPAAAPSATNYAGYIPSCYSVTGILGTLYACGTAHNASVNGCYNKFGNY